MTPLKPLENLRVRGVAAERYPPNTKCSHPDCAEDATDQHHCFPRSQIKGDSWFVEITWEGDGMIVPGVGPVENKSIIPHVTGLCREHHDAVESHSAWIKLENGVFVWYDRKEDPDAGKLGIPNDAKWWIYLGPLNPQPGSRESKPKRKRFQGEQRRQRKVISIKVPQDTENGGAIYDETLALVKDKLVTLGLYEEGADIPAYEATIAAWADWLNS